MKKIDESAINSQTGMLSPSGVLQHLQNSYTDLFGYLGAIIASNSGINGTGLFIIDGVSPVLAAGTLTFGNGLIYYNGELFYIASGSVVITTTSVFTIQNNYFTGANADPVLFTDGTSRNVLQIRTMTIRDSSSIPGGETTTGINALGGSVKYSPKGGGYIYSNTSLSILLNTSDVNIKTNIIPVKTAFLTNLEFTISIRVNSGTPNDIVSITLYNRDTLAVYETFLNTVVTTNPQMMNYTFIVQNVPSTTAFNLSAKMLTGAVYVESLVIAVREIGLGVNQ
jgi:hypothetical protein